MCVIDLGYNIPCVLVVLESDILSSAQDQMVLASINTVTFSGNNLNLITTSIDHSVDATGVQFLFLAFTAVRVVVVIGVVLSLLQAYLSLALGGNNQSSLL